MNEVNGTHTSSFNFLGESFSMLRHEFAMKLKWGEKKDSLDLFVMSRRRVVKTSCCENNEGLLSKHPEMGGEGT